MPRLEQGPLPLGREFAKMDGFMAPSSPQDRVGDVERRQALVDHPEQYVMALFLFYWLEYVLLGRRTRG